MPQARLTAPRDRPVRPTPPLTRRRPSAAPFHRPIRSADSYRMATTLSPGLPGFPNSEGLRAGVVVEMAQVVGRGELPWAGGLSCGGRRVAGRGAESCRGRRVVVHA